MFCPKCGTENAEGALFCTACGNAMTTAPVEESAPVVEETVETVSAPETQEAPKKDLLAPIKPLLEKITPFVQKNKLFVFGGLGIIACVLCIILLCAIFGGGNGYDAYKHSIEVNIVEDEIVIIYDAKKAKYTGVEAKGIDDTQASIDGSILVLLTDEGELYFVKGTKITKIDEEVENFVLSVDGTGVGYVTETDDGESLNLYNIKNRKSKTVTNDLSGYNYTLSPNGDSICYYQEKEDDEEPSLMYFKGSKSTKVTSNEVELIGLSNNGKYIYVMGEDDEGDEFLYRYNTKGDKDKIGACNAPAFYFNEDHTQIAYFNSDNGYKTYLSTNGKEGKKIASSIASPLLPRSVGTFSQGYTATFATDNLYNKVYTCQSENGVNVWYIRKNADKSVKLVNNVSRVTISEDAKMVYYIDDGELKVLTVSKGDNASDKAKVLAEDIDSYVVTSDCKKLYYTADDALYCVNAKNGKSKKTVANDEVESGLYINAKDVVYYIMDGDAYATKNGSKGKKVVTDADGLHQTANGIVYVSADDDIYATSGAKKPSKIFEEE